MRLRENEQTVLKSFTKKMRATFSEKEYIQEQIAAFCKKVPQQLNGLFKVANGNIHILLQKKEECK